jgi:HEAT repeat protein
MPQSTTIKACLVCLCLCGLLRPAARADDEADLQQRIDALKEFPEWQKKPLTRPRLQQCLKELRSRDKEVQRAALEALAYARPDPQASDVVLRDAFEVRKQHDDKFSLNFYIHINAAWSEAKSAAKTLDRARRSGGLKYLERMLAEGKGLDQMAALSALAYSDDAGAGEVLVRQYAAGSNRGMVCRMLCVLGPKGAPPVVDLLDDADWIVRMDAARVLKKIGTPAELPALEARKEDPNGNARKAVVEAIDAIRARETSDQ